MEEIRKHTPVEEHARSNSDYRSFPSKYHNNSLRYTALLTTYIHLHRIKLSNGDQPRGRIRTRGIAITIIVIINYLDPINSVNFDSFN